MCRWYVPNLSSVPVHQANSSLLLVACSFSLSQSKSLYHSMLSVVERSPPELLHEIILVDDGSDAVRSPRTLPQPHHQVH